MVKKDLIIEQLQILADNTEGFKSQAYKKAIRVLRNDYPSDEINSSRDVSQLPGIGKKISAKIDELIEMDGEGNIQAVQKIMDAKEMETDEERERRLTIKKFSKIHGVSEEVATRWYDRDGLRSIEEVKKRKDLSRASVAYLRHFDDLEMPIYRSQIEMLEVLFVYLLLTQYDSSDFRYGITGSYRRGSASSSDLDMVIATDKFKLADVVDLLVKWGIILEILAQGETKLMAIAQCPTKKWPAFRLDIWFVSENQWGAALLATIGPKSYVTSVRERANKMGYKLTEKGLYRGNVRLPVFSEEEILDVLELKWIPPNKR